MQARNEFSKLSETWQSRDEKRIERGKKMEISVISEVAKVIANLISIVIGVCALVAQMKSKTIKPTTMFKHHKRQKLSKGKTQLRRRLLVKFRYW